MSPSQRNWHATFGIQLPARDLNFVSEENYEKLNQRVVEIKRMLASLVCKVDADRLAG